MAYIEVDVDLDCFDTDDIVDELISRLKYQKGRKSLTDKQKQEMSNEFLNLLPVKGIEIKSLEDKLKFEHFANVFHRYSISDIENRLP
jgi:hypothetical protein